MKKYFAAAAAVLVTSQILYADIYNPTPAKAQPLNSLSCASVPTGSVTAFAGSTVPLGYLVSDGSAVNRTTYAALFAAIGTTYGSGDGSTTFNLPDLRGHFTASGLVTSGANIGDIITTASSTCPSGTVQANGASYATATYPLLFSTIGYTHGGSGSNFNVPDYRGRFLRGVDEGAGNDPDTSTRSAMNVGGNTGDAIGSLQSQATALNGILLHDPGHSHASGAYQNQDPNGWGEAFHSGFGYASSVGGVLTNNVGPSATGIFLTGDTETRPRNAYVNYCIRTLAQSLDYVIKY
jgi:microcystin-dependent protein